MPGSKPCPKYFTGGKVIDSGKHSSLIQYGNNYCRKKSYSTGSTGLYYKTFYGRNLRIFV